MLLLVRASEGREIQNGGMTVGVCFSAWSLFFGGGKTGRMVGDGVVVVPCNLVLLMYIFYLMRWDIIGIQYILEESRSFWLRRRVEIGKSQWSISISGGEIYCYSN